MLQSVKTKLEAMNLVDQFLFNEVVQDPLIFQMVVSILLDKEITLLGKAETEKEFRVSPELRGIRLDSVAMDTDHKVYTVEMQKRDTKNLPKRSRLYQGHIDVSLMEPGSVDFNVLNNVCQITVTPFDIFGRGLYRYTFRGVCVECPDLEIGDGAWRIFINTTGTNPECFSQEFLDFMDYITDSTYACARKAKSPRIMQIHKRVLQVKQLEKMGVKTMQLWEELIYEREDGRLEGLAEGRTEGLAQGRTEGKIDSILQLLSDLGNIPEDIRALIQGERDEKLLHRWLKLAATVDSFEEFREKLWLSIEQTAG